MTAKNFFVITAAFELLTAIALLVSPSLTAYILVGSTLETPASIMVARVAGAALLTIAIVCWNARSESNSIAAIGIIKAMLCYNLLVILLLAYGAITSSLMGVGFFPAMIAHIILGGWGAACFSNTSNHSK